MTQKRRYTPAQREARNETQRRRQAARRAAAEPRSCEQCGALFQSSDTSREPQRLCSRRCASARGRAGRALIPLADRFWSKVARGAPEECWLWTGYRNPDGYGRIGRGGRGGSLAYAHRVAFELEVGPIPPGLEVDHLCFNPPCTNPAHLEPVTGEENLRREWDRRRVAGAA